MRNWSIDEKQLKKDPKRYAVWRLEQMANFGLGKEKIRLSEYRAFADVIAIHDPWRKKYLDMIVYEQDDSF